MTAEDRAIQRDRMRFIKNSLSANLALLGILFNVFYFISICKSDVGTWYYTILIGASIVYNLVFMLAVFLSSEGVKNYKQGYSYLLAALGVFQIVRIFIIPARAHAAETLINGETALVMQDGQFYRVTTYLIISAVCLIASAAVNLIRCRELAEHLKALDSQGA
ncbi:MAG: hypothetical protein HFF19_03245 [Oscillospiraceae bacterium]|jgi:hypothetical protein|nr:hypothetical protein [Oscillospiraceae bacterium]